METQEVRRNNKWQPEAFDYVVIFHGGCPDGVGSAYAFTCGIFAVRNVYFHHANERDFAKDKYMPSLVGKHVYIVDFSYPKETLEYIRSVATDIHVYDHHKSAYEDLKDLPYCVFDMNRCGAEITWDELHGQHTRPWFMKHIRDRDLWLWQNPDSHEFSAVFQDEGLRIDVLKKYANYDANEIQSMYIRGRVLMEIEKSAVKKLCMSAEKAKFEGHDVYVLNATSYVSECGNELAGRDRAFALIYRYSLLEDSWYISLRGKPNTIDLSIIAKKYGGGGHPPSSGFKWRGNIKDIVIA